MLLFAINEANLFILSLLLSGRIGEQIS